MSDLSLPHFVNLELEDFDIALVYIFYLAVNRMPLFQDFFIFFFFCVEAEKQYFSILGVIKAGKCILFSSFISLSSAIILDSGISSWKSKCLVWFGLVCLPVKEDI